MLVWMRLNVIQAMKRSMPLTNEVESPDVLHDNTNTVQRDEIQIRLIMSLAVLLPALIMKSIAKRNLLKRQ